MNLTFNLTNCQTTFKAFDKYKRTEVSFFGRPKSFAITSQSGVSITEQTDSKADGTQIEIVIVADEFEGGSPGLLHQEGDWGLCIALSCSQQQMSDLNIFIANGLKPDEVQISIDNLVLVQRNFKMTDGQYEISSWQFKI